MATDDFNRADGGLGANWDAEDWYIGGDTFDFEIVSNQVRQTGGTSYARYVGTFDNDQRAEVTIIAPSSVNDQGVGVALRMNDSGTPDTFSGYDFTGKNDYGVIRRWDDGARTIIDNPGWSAGAGDVIGGESEGSDHRIYLNDVEEGSASDAAYAAGNPGLAGFAFGASSGTEMDDWTGENLAAPPPPVLPYLGLMEVDLNQFALLDADLAFDMRVPREGLIYALARHAADGLRFFRHTALRTVHAREILRILPRLGAELRRWLVDAIKRSTRAWSCRRPNTRAGRGWHVKRCRDLWVALESFSPKLNTGVVHVH